MLNINRKTAIIFFAAALALTAGAAALLVLALANEYDSVLCHFSTSALFAPAVYVILGVSCALGIALAVFSRKAEPNYSKNAGIFESFTSAFSAILIVCALVFDYIGKAESMESTAPVLIGLYSVFAVLSSVALVMYAISGSYKSTAAKVLSLCPPLYCAAQTLILYFDKTIAVNGPIKILTQLAYVALMLMFVSDAGIAVGKDKIYGKYMMFSVWACVMSGVISVAALVSQLMKMVYFEITLADTCLLFALFLLSVSKLYRGVSILPKAEEDQ